MLNSEMPAGETTGSLPLDQRALAQLFLEARTYQNWKDKPVPDDLLRHMVDLAKMGPTSVNGSPMRIVFVRHPDAKMRLQPALHPANMEKTMSAPVTAIIAYDLAFFSQLAKLSPNSHVAKKMLEEDVRFAQDTAFRNGTLQGAYLIMAARALGLDCGPLSGFDSDKVDAEFFAGTQVRSNFICNIGYGDRSGLRPRRPRFTFEEIAKII